MAISPTSLKNWRSYRNGLPGQHFSMVETKFSLQQIDGDSGNFCKVEFSMVGKTPEEVFIALSTPINYQGQSIRKGEAIVAEFLAKTVEREQEFDSEDSDTVDGEDEY